jgi:hypothetical protein
MKILKMIIMLISLIAVVIILMTSIKKLQKAMPKDLSIWPVLPEEIEKDKEIFYAQNDPDDRLITLKCSNGKLYTIWKSRIPKEYMLPFVDEYGRYVSCSN